jgi:ribosome-binding protein aMBF1 (putative translation factor)
MYINGYGRGEDRFAVLTTLFKTFSSDGTVNGYWTPDSTARLEAHVKASISCPDPEKVLELSGQELAHYMATDAKANRDAYQRTPSANGEAQTEAQAAARILFDAIDTNADGKISREELAARLKVDAELVNQLEEGGITTKHYVLEQIDADEDGTISLLELEAAIKKARERVDKMNRGILAFVCSIKNTPAKVAAYGNKKAPPGGLNFSEVWEATWNDMLTDKDLKTSRSQHWWDLEADESVMLQDATADVVGGGHRNIEDEAAHADPKGSGEEKKKKKKKKKKKVNAAGITETAFGPPAIAAVDSPSDSDDLNC